MSQPVRIVHAGRGGPPKVARSGVQVRGTAGLAAEGDSSDAVASTAFVGRAVASAGVNYQPHAPGLDALAAAGQGAFGLSLLGLGDAGAGRTALGLGALAVKGSVGDADWGGAVLALAHGGTGGADAATARANLAVYSSSETGAAITAAVTAAAANYQPRAAALGVLAAAAQGAFGLSLLGLADAAAGRTSLGLGALATKGSVNNADWSGADLDLSNGGTGASTAAAARTNLGVYSTGETGAAISAAIGTAAGSYAPAAAGIPAGGASGQVLTKTGASSFATGWMTLGALASKGSVNNADWVGTDLDLSNGGTGASTAADARTNLGVYSTVETGAAISAAIGTAAGNYAPAAAGVPAGGATGQVLTKTGASSFATGWTTLGTAAGATLGSSGVAVPLLSTSNTWSQGQTVPDLGMTGSSGNARGLYWRTDSSLRWTLVADNTPETGGNSGSLMRLRAYADDGSLTGQVFSVPRDTQVASFNQPPTWPTPASSDSSTSGATTAWVTSYLAGRRGVANGVAGLDATAKLPIANLPTLTMSNISDITSYGRAILDDTSAAAQRMTLGLESYAGHGDADYTIMATDKVVALNATPTAPRVWTLPRASELNPGQTLTVVIATSQMPYPLTIAAQSGETINGGLSLTLTTPRTAMTFYSNHDAVWSTDGRLTALYANQPPNTVFAGPTGSPFSTPSFRGLTTQDIPDLSSTYEKVGNKNSSGGYAGYLEGTWTPTVSLLTPGTSSVTYGVRSGSYVRIGNLVTVSFTVTFVIVKGSGSGRLRIEGLPFAVSDTTTPTGSVRGLTPTFVWPNGYTSVGLNTAATTALAISLNGSGLSSTTIDGSCLTDGGSHTIVGSISYKT